MPQEYLAVCTCGRTCHFDSREPIARMACPVCRTPLMAAATLRALGEDERVEQFPEPLYHT